MKINNRRPNVVKVFGFLTLFGLGLWTGPSLRADVVVLQSGAVITGTILQQDGNGVLLQMEYGTFRYPLNLVREVRKEAAAARHVSNNGQVIPDWAQIVSVLANNPWADSLQQVPAPVISYSLFKNIPYISFRCAAGGYEINIYGDLNNPAAIQVGAMAYLHDDAAAKSNCVNFVCSVLASADARKMVRALDFTRKEVLQSGGMTGETILPGEWGSYGGWWVLVYNQNLLASAQASEAEMLALTQPRVATAPPLPAPAPTAASDTSANNSAAATGTAPAPAPAPAQPVTTTTYETYGYGTSYAAAAGWTAAEINQAHPVIPPASYPATYPADAAKTDEAAKASDYVYPRTYARTAEAYGNAYRHR